MKGTKVSTIIAFASIFVIIAGIIFAAPIINLFLMAMFMGIILLQPIRWLQSKKVPQGLAVILVFISVLVLFVSFGKIINNSISSITKDIPRYHENFEKMEENLVVFLNEKGINVTLETLQSKVSRSKLIELSTGVLTKLGSVAGRTITILFLMLFLLFEKTSLGVKFKAITKSTKVPITYLRSTGKSIRHYLAIKTITSLLTGLLIWIFLSIIGLEHALLWGLIAFLLNYIPSIGSFVAAAPAILFAIVTLDSTGIIWVIVVFLAVNVIVGSFIEPKVMGKGLGISTFVVFAGLFFWGFLLGTAGMFLSVPLTMAIKALLELNENTRWMAVLLGTGDDAEKIMRGEVK